MKRKNQLVALVIFALALAFTIPAQNLEEKVFLKKLSNGLTVIIVPRHDAPVFSGLYGFKVGSVDEQPGITGVAHLFEHMAFKGTPRIGSKDFAKEQPLLEESNKVGRELSLELMKGENGDQGKVKSLQEKLRQVSTEQKKYIVKDEIMTIYSNAGGVFLNAGTGNDNTSYMISLPGNRFELYCLMESERMRNAVLREFYTERGVIQEERKQTTDAVPGEVLAEVFMATAFLAHPYKNPVIGWASDINSVTLEEAYAFKKKYYTPNNCVLVLVGDLEPKTAMPLIEKYFGALPKGEEPPELRTVEPKQLGERRIKLELDAEPLLIMGFHKPNFPHKDDVIASTIAKILTSGNSSRLNRELVQKTQIAASIDAYSDFPGSRYPNLLFFNAAPRYPHTVEELEAGLWQELEKLKNEPVSELELQKVKNNLEAGFIRSMASNMGLAFTLIDFQLLHGDWKLYLKQKEMLAAITPDDIQNFARTYLTIENHTVGVLQKKAQ